MEGVKLWLVEFILRQSPLTIDDTTLSSLLFSLSSSFSFIETLNNDINNNNNNRRRWWWWRISKSLLLRRLSSETTIISSSRNSLRLLELIEEIDHQAGIIPPSPSLKRAYCHLSVHSTLLHHKPSSSSSSSSFVNRIMNNDLVSDQLLAWMTDIHKTSSFDGGDGEENTTVFSPTWSKDVDPVGALKAYIAEAWEQLGPTFLDQVAASSSHVLLLLSSEDTHEEEEEEEEEEEALKIPPPSPSPQNNPLVRTDATMNIDTMTQSRLLSELPIINHENYVSQNDSRMPRRKHLAEKRNRVSASGTSRGAKITDPEQVVNEVLSERYGCLPSPAIDKVQEALKSSTLELNAIVTDPLPEAPEIAKNAISSKNKDNGNVEDMENDGDPKRPSTSHENNVRKPSLMTRNTSARTVEWDDSIDDLPEGDTGSRSRIKFPSPRNRVVSPLKIHQMRNRKGRNKYITWTALEEATLRTGVKKFGEGCWTTILNSHRDIFKTRTAVDLKDKWRNLTK